MKENNVITVSLNARLQPKHRHGLEDVIDELLHERSIGYICGGGTLMSENGEISHSDIEINFNNMSQASIDEVVNIFTAIFAPKGSKITLKNQSTEFGEQEGLALYLNGSDLPKEVYETSDINKLWDDIDRILGDEGRIHSYADLERETALYLYGNSFEAMSKLIEPIIATHSLCQQCRIIQIA